MGGLVTWVTWLHRYIGTCAIRGAQRADDVHQIAIGPVVAFEQRPEGHDQNIHLWIWPGAVSGGGHRLAQHWPFGRIFEALRRFTMMPLPRSEERRVGKE